MSDVRARHKLTKSKLPEIPLALREEQVLYKFNDAEVWNSGCTVRARIDPKGHVMYWKRESSGRTEVLDLLTVCDTRQGKYAKVPPDIDKYRDSIPLLSIENDSFFTIVTLPDRTLIRPAFITFNAGSPQAAAQWCNIVFKIGTSIASLQGSQLFYLDHHYAKLRYAVDQDGKIHTSDIIKSLATSAHNKKRVEGALASADLPKDEAISPESFTEEKFFLLYRQLTQRNDVLEIFKSLRKSTTPESGEIFRNVDELVIFLNEEQRDPRLNEILYPPHTRKTVQRLVERYEPNPTVSKKGEISLQGFLRYLLSDDNAVLSEEVYEYNEQDMDEPYAHYYIASSHNTYLTAKQVGLPTARAPSSVEIYRQCLLTGCRCVELDCWDGKEATDEPIITHGGAFCDYLLFKDVIEAIAESAFKVSDLPVVLSFENHCSNQNQAIMAKHCKEIFGSMLLSEPVSEYPLEPGQHCPPPNMLRGKILIKNQKRMVQSDTSFDSRNSSIKHEPSTSTFESHISTALSIDSSKSNRSDSIPDSPIPEPISDNPSADSITQQLMAPSGESSRSTTPRNKSPQPEISESGGDVTDDDEESKLHSVPGSAKMKFTNPELQAEVIRSKLSITGSDATIGSCCSDGDQRSISTSEAPTESLADSAEECIPLQPVPEDPEARAGAEISALVNYVQAVKIDASLRGLELAKRRDCSYHIASFASTSAMKLLTNRGTDFVMYNKRQLSRIYPPFLNVDSKNFNPQVHWNAGCQMVALNYQTLDLGMQLNLGLFERNGRSGYLLKPLCMRRQEQYVDPFEQSSVDNVVANSLSVEIMSGQLLSDKKVVTYVLVEIYGHISDSRRDLKTRKTENSIDAIFESNPKAFEFPKIILPELATLRLALCEENGKLLGQRFLPIKGLRPGYRHVSLRNALNQPLGLATLFVRIKVKDFVPETHQGFVDALLDPIQYFQRFDHFADALANPIAHVKELKKREAMLRALAGEDEIELASRDPDAMSDDALSVTSSMAHGGFGRPSKDSLAYLRPGSRPPSITDMVSFGQIPNNNIGDLTFPFNIPTLEMLKNDGRGNEKIRRRQEQELESFYKRIDKEILHLRRKHNKRLEEANRHSSHSRFSALPQLKGSLLPSLKKFDPVNLLDAVKARPGNEPNGQVPLDQRELVAKLKTQAQEEEEYLRRRVLEDELSLRKQHEAARKQLLEELIAQKLRICIKILEMRYKKEKEKKMRDQMEKKKHKLAEISNRNCSREEMLKLRQEADSEAFKASVAAGRTLMQAEETKKTELEKGFRNLRDKLEQSYITEIRELEAEFRTKLNNKDWPKTRVTKL